MTDKIQQVARNVKERVKRSEQETEDWHTRHPEYRRVRPIEDRIKQLRQDSTKTTPPPKEAPAPSLIPKVVKTVIDALKIKEDVD